MQSIQNIVLVLQAVIYHRHGISLMNSDKTQSNNDKVLRK